MENFLYCKVSYLKYSSSLVHADLEGNDLIWSARGYRIGKSGTELLASSKQKESTQREPSSEQHRLF
jgi:hypothetical protein